MPVSKEESEQKKQRRTGDMLFPIIKKWFPPQKIPIARLRENGEKVYISYL